MAERCEENTALYQQGRYFAQCALFNHSAFFKVEVLDANEKGISIKTRSPAKPGAFMLVREIKPDTTKNRNNRSSEFLPSIATGEVVRCEQMSDVDGQLFYGIRLRYLIPSV